MNDDPSSDGADALLLLRRVSEVARAAATADPSTITQRAFNAARAQNPSFRDVPDARRISERLGIPWDDATVLAQEPLETQKRRLVQKQRSGGDGADWVSTEHVAAVLDLVATRLHTTSVTQSDYLAERERMLAETPRPRDAMPLPTVDQIRVAMQRDIHGKSKRRMSFAGTWKRALEVAGLDPEPSVTQRVKGRSAVELLELAYKAHGTQVTSGEAQTFAKANGIPESKVTRPWSKCVAEWKQRREAAGEDVPDGPPPLDQRPDYSVDVGAAAPGERRRPSWTRDSVVAVLTDYLEQMAPGQQASLRHYWSWARALPRTPSPNTLNEYGGWPALSKLAQDEVVKRRTAAKAP